MLLLGSLPTFIPTAGAFYVLPGTYFTAAGGLRNYTVERNMTFSSIILTPSTVTFNSTMIIPYSGSTTYIGLEYIDHDPLTTIAGERVLEYNYTSVDPATSYYISGLKNTYVYHVDRNNVSWQNFTSDGSGTITFISAIIGTVNVKIYDNSAVTDVTSPVITINFAGNHSDRGGPYYRPEGESTALSGANLNGYYTNNSYQNESWMYINTTITDNVGVQYTRLHWHNETTGSWYNTTGLIKRNTNYYDYNTSVNITNITIGHKYSFDIYAYDAAGNIRRIYWNKTDLGSDITRRYVHLKNQYSSIEYKALYFSNIGYSAADQNKYDRLQKDQSTGREAAGTDTSYLTSTVPTDTVQYRTGVSSVGGWFNNNSCVTPFTLTNIYCHVWETSDDILNTWHYYGKSRQTNFPAGSLYNWYFNIEDYEVTHITYSGTQYYLIASGGTRSIGTDYNFTDNNIHELYYGISTALATDNPKMISNRSFTSFIIINVPSNAILNATYGDSDHDNLSDYTELYYSFTNPFLQDTDNDGYNDTVEYYGGSDQNIYTNIPPSSPETIPTVLTNESTNILATQATLNGYIVSNGYSNITTAGFNFGTTTSYGTNINCSPLFFTFLNGTAFWYTYPGLNSGKLYHFRAFATNGIGTSYGIDRSFVTKPTQPTALSIANTGVDNVQSLTWTHGTGYNNTVMRAAVDGPYPTTPQSDTSIYNNTGTSTTVNNTFLLPGRLYYYRAWEYAYWGALHQFSDSYAQTIGLTKPYAPTHANISITFPVANLSWAKGDGANQTRIVYKSTGYPTSPTDGTLIYNGTGTYYLYTITNGTVYYFTAFSYTSYGSRSTYADNHTDFESANITGGGFIINCYDEETHANLTFNILITNPDGTDTYVNTSCVNPLLINSSLTPHGAQISVFVSAADHRTRVYTMALYDGIIYTLNAYLPRNTTNGTGDDCIQKGYMDYFIITNPAIDVLMNLTKTVYFIEEVEVYNTSVNYWYEVNYTYNPNNTLRISHLNLDVNTTMARVTYYYMDCGNTSYSYLYYFQVIVDPQGTTISNASVQIKKYINNTGTFEIISNLYTDSNGFFNIWLIPGSLYKIICNKEGYNQEIVDFIPSTVTFAHTIKMTLISTIPQPPIIEPESIHFTGELGYFNGNNTYVLNLTYYDSSGYTNSTTLLIYAYNFSTNTSILIITYTTTANQSWTYRLYNIDRNMTYTCRLTYVHFYLGTQQRSYVLEHQIWIPITPEEVNDLFDWLGIIPFGAVNLIMWLLFVAVCYYADSRDIGKIIIILGVIYLFLGTYVGLKTQLFGSVGAIAGGALPAIFIAMGILIEWSNSRRRM